MNRFVRRTTLYNRYRLPAAVCGLVLVLLLFTWGIKLTGNSARDAARDTLEQALAYNITYCYAMEGSYPESVEYMEQNYGLTYDKDRFYIGYRLQGSNIKPQVTIIELN